MKRSPIALVSAGLTLLLLAGCAQYENRRGVEVSWQPDALTGLVRGQTTRQEVLQLLGPPSQVIALDDETVLYYLFERSEGEGVVLIVYNRMQIDTRYDRAILFFDQNDLLSDFATRIQGEE
jgi:outer membrane protein assembly factor BamE (lipoprotein component of BamABCDE complex)